MPAHFCLDHLVLPCRVLKRLHYPGLLKPFISAVLKDCY